MVNASSELNYDILKGAIYNRLYRVHHDRHLEDCTSFAVIKWLEGVRNYDWIVADYCRLNGLSKRAKVGSFALERASKNSYKITGFERGIRNDNANTVDSASFEIEKDTYKNWLENKDEEDFEIEFKPNKKFIIVRPYEEKVAPNFTPKLVTEILNLNEETSLWLTKTCQLRKLKRTAS